jgi:hypothetical protein
METLTVASLLAKSSLSYDALQSWQEPATAPYLEPADCRSHTVFLEAYVNILSLSTHIYLFALGVKD